MDKSTLPLFAWEERKALMEGLQTHPGAASSLKVVLIGFPDRLEQKKDYVIVWIADRMGRATIPRGLPAPPDEPTVCKV